MTLQYKPRLKVYKNSTDTNTFDGKEARSYNHWCYGLIIDDVAYVTAKAYSPTTSKHIKDFGRLFSWNYSSVPNVDDSDRVHPINSMAIPRCIRHSISLLEQRQANPRVRPANKESIPAELEQLVKLLAVFEAYWAKQTGETEQAS